MSLLSVAFHLWHLIRWLCAIDTVRCFVNFYGVERGLKRAQVLQLGDPAIELCFVSGLIAILVLVHRVHKVLCSITRCGCGFLGLIILLLLLRL